MRLVAVRYASQEVYSKASGDGVPFLDQEQTLSNLHCGSNSECEWKFFFLSPWLYMVITFSDDSADLRDRVVLAMMN